MKLSQLFEADLTTQTPLNTAGRIPSAEELNHDPKLVAELTLDGKIIMKSSFQELINFVNSNWSSLDGTFIFTHKGAYLHHVNVS